MGFGERLRNARNNAGLTQEQVRSLMGWQSQGVVSKYENEGSEPSIEDFQKLGAVLNVSAAWLAFGHGYTPTSAKVISIDKSKLIDFSGAQAHEFFDYIGSEPIYYLAAQSIVGYAFHDDEMKRPSISIHTTLPAQQSDRYDPLQMRLHFKDKGGEYQRVRRELLNCFTASEKHSEIEEG